MKLSENAQNLANKLTDAGLDQDHAEEWVNEILDEAVEHWKTYG